MLLTSVYLSVRPSVCRSYFVIVSMQLKCVKNEFLSFIPQNYIFFSVQKKKYCIFLIFCLKFLMLTCFTHYVEKIPFDSVKYCNRGLNINKNIFQIIIKFLNVMTYKENKKIYFTDTFFEAKKKHMYRYFTSFFWNSLRTFFLRFL